MSMIKHGTKIVMLLSSSSLASADPPAGRRAPEFALESTSGTTRRLRDYRDRVVVVVYEDRDAGQQNQGLKDELARRAARTSLAAEVALLPVADLRGYAFWPAQGFARDAVVAIARQLGVEILIDWSGAMGNAYRAVPRASNVFIVARDGRLVYAHSGALVGDERDRFFRVLSATVAGQ